MTDALSLPPCGTDALDLAILDRWQRDFPLASRPYAEIADHHAVSEMEILERLKRLSASGVISRIGAAVRPNTAGASTLAALKMPPDRLNEVAALVSAEPFVNHNYQRDHAYNLWFVVAAPDRPALEATIASIETTTGLAVLDLPLEKPYFIDLGFRLDRARHSPPARRAIARRVDIDAEERAALVALENGLPVAARPFLETAQACGQTEAGFIGRIAHLLDDGVISRFGLVLHHRALGFVANAMAVWDVPDHMVDEVAASLVRTGMVSLCYRRPRRLPDWPYNLFAMIHAKDRAAARATVLELNAVAGTRQLEQHVLFSSRCFKQRGAVFSARAEAGAR